MAFTADVTSLNKPNIHSLPLKFSLTLRMVRDFMNSWFELVVPLLDFSWTRYEGRQEKNNSHNLQNSGFPNISTSGIPANSNRELATGNMDFLKSVRFFMKQSYALKTFLFQKNISCKLDDSIPARNLKKTFVLHSEFLNLFMTTLMKIF